MISAILQIEQILSLDRLQQIFWILQRRCSQCCHAVNINCDADNHTSSVSFCFGVHPACHSPQLSSSTSWLRQSLSLPPRLSSARYVCPLLRGCSHIDLLLHMCCTEFLCAVLANVVVTWSGALAYWIFSHSGSFRSLVTCLAPSMHFACDLVLQLEHDI
jgi:hypothetical protein